MEIQQAQQQIDQITIAFTDTFGDLTEEELNWRPDNHSWSIAQNIAHLIIINKSYFSLIKSVQEGNYRMPWLGKFNVVTSFFGNTMLKAVQPDRERKVKTFTIWEPETSKISGDILQRFVKHQEELKQTIVMCQPLIHEGAVISSPASKIIVYKLETVFDIMITHEGRHLEQAKEVLALIEKKSAASNL